ncbi:intercellular adhesion molecule 2 isoform X2 [Marmota flaviventris]|uniref:intercellular adhesion molecule 2 isoform X2 n=1 Tax=Marmota flaviventris TaxID=93162 RepID=UPI003A87A77E
MLSTPALDGQQESGEAAFEVHIWPERLVVENGGSRTVNCSTSCANPDTGGLETTLEKTLLEDQPRWKSFWISNVSWDSVLFCYFTCAGEQQSKSLNVSMYQFPKQIILQLQPVWVTLGKPFTIECRVSAVKPLESLTLTLLRGKETLHSQTFNGGATDPQEARVTFNSTASKEDGLLNFSCQAELDLRSRGGDILRNISENKVLQVYEPPPENQMVIIVTVVSVLLFLFVMSVLLCFVFGQHWRQRRMGTYGVRAAWRRLPQVFRVQHM